MLGEVGEQRPPQQTLPAPQQQQQQIPQQEQQQMLPPKEQRPISMRVVIIALDRPDSYILSDVHLPQVPSSIAALRVSVAHLLSQHGFVAGEALAKNHGVVKVTRGREAPGVQLEGQGRVVLFKPVVWERSATGDEEEGEVRERLGEAALLGDWIVFVVIVPSATAAAVPTSSGGQIAASVTGSVRAVSEHGNNSPMEMYYQICGLTMRDRSKPGGTGAERSSRATLRK